MNITADLIARFAEANPEEARRVFAERFASERNADRRTDLEIAREYLTNPAFRAAMQDVVRAVND